MVDWAIQALQLVWFGNGADVVKSDDLFRAAFGVEAETVQRNRVPGPTNPFWGTASGLVPSGQRGEVQVQPGRVDVLFMPIGDDLAPTMPLALLRDISPIASALSSIGPAIRVAIVADLVSISASAETATTLAQQLAAVPQPVLGVTDFSMQMNLRMPYSSAKGEHMNRLLRWATATFQVLRFQVSGGSGAINPVTELSHAASVRLDINSVPSNRLIDPPQQIAMYDDMRNEIDRLAVEPTLNRLLVNNA